MNITFSIRNDSDEKVVDRARRRIATMTKGRWIAFAYGVGFLAVAIYPTVKTITRLESLDERQLTMGFVYGVALGILWITFGLLGGLCIGKFLAGCQKDFREPELLVRYHDRLRELGELSSPRERQ